jgi:hypothetical protein
MPYFLHFGRKKKQRLGAFYASLVIQNEGLTEKENIYSAHH